MGIEPWINWQFNKRPGRIDPRATFTRASVGRIAGRGGLLAAIPANTGRWRFNPATGASEGLLCEPARTNLALYSEQFDNAAWTATDCTVAADAATAPDGTTTADSLTVTAADGNVAQAVTITSGYGAAASVHAKAFATSFLYAQATGGTDTVEVWFNLSAGTVGTNTSGASTVVLSQARIESAGGGFYRCSVEVTTATVTTLTVQFSAAAADGSAPANTDSVYVWGAQIEAASAETNRTSYIPTTTATVTRSADLLLMPVTSQHVALDRGTIIFEWTQQAATATASGLDAMFGGIGNTSGDAVYIYRASSNTIAAKIVGSSVDASFTAATCAFAQGATYKFGFTWDATRYAKCVDGGAVVAETKALPSLASVARIAIGASPWSTAVSSAQLNNVAYRAFRYAPHIVDDDTLQALTAAA
jgi:hypothetical protein